MTKQKQNGETRRVYGKQLLIGPNVTTMLPLSAAMTLGKTLRLGPPSKEGRGDDLMAVPLFNNKIDAL